MYLYIFTCMYLHIFEYMKIRLLYCALYSTVRVLWAMQRLLREDGAREHSAVDLRYCIFVLLYA